MKEQIMVFSKEWFKKYNKTLCWFANTPIIKYWFRWLLRIHKDIPWSEKIEEIMPNAFTYGKKLVLVDCVKLKDREEVFDESKKLHRKLRDKGLLIKKLRYQQTTDFRTHEKFGKRLYYGLKPLWYVLHFWDWSTSIQPALNCGFDTLTVYPDYSGKVGEITCDGNVSCYGKDESLASLIADTGNFSNYDYWSGSIGRLKASTTSNQFDAINRGIFLFDTSALTSSATISAATVSFYGQAQANGLGDDNFHLCASTPASNTVLANSDYANLGSTSFGSVAYGDISLISYFNITVNATGIAAISKTAITKYGTRIGWDITGTFGGTWSSLATTNCSVYTADDLGAHGDPKLVITYSVVVPGNAIFFGCNC